MTTYLFGRPSGALFVSPKGLKIQLNAGTKFDIAKRGEQAYVVVDGKGIKITDSERRSLVKGSQKLRPTAEHKDRVKFLYDSRKHIQETAIRYMKELQDRGISDIVPFYTSSETGVAASVGRSKIVFGFQTYSVGFACYCKDEKELKSLLKTGIYPALSRRASRLAKKFRDLDIGDFRELKAHLGNVQIPTVGKFSGTCKSCYASWSI